MLRAYYRSVLQDIIKPGAKSHAFSSPISHSRVGPRQGHTHTSYTGTEDQGTEGKVLLPGPHPQSKGASPCSRARMRLTGWRGRRPSQRVLSILSGKGQNAKSPSPELEGLERLLILKHLPEAPGT